MATYTVGIVGTHDYATVAAVNAVTFSSGDEVLFNRGETFTASQLTCDQSGVTYGATGSGALPIIDGGGTLTPINISQNCTFQDMRVIDPAGATPRAVYMSAGVVTIQRCEFDGNATARGIQYAGGTLTIDNCVTTNCTTGIYMAAVGIVNIRNTTVTTGTSNGVYSANATVVNCTNVHVTGYTLSGIVADVNSVMTCTLCSANSNTIDGFQSNNSGVLTCYGCTANSNGGVAAGSGDGFTSHLTAELYIYGCQASKNFKSGFQNSGSSQGEIINCSFYDNYDDTISSDNYGISFTNTAGNWICKNNITQGHRIEIQISGGAVGGTGVFSIENNIYNNTRTTPNAWSYNGSSVSFSSFNTSVSDTTSQNIDPLFIDAESLNLTVQSNSPAIAAATKWWTGANPVGASGEPFSDFDTDIGASQSTHSPFHPKNL